MRSHTNRRVSPQPVAEFSVLLNGFSGMFRSLLRPALRGQLLSALTPRRHDAQTRAKTSATVRLLDDCLGEFNDSLSGSKVTSFHLTGVEPASPELNRDGTPMRFNYVWLRDHCRSAASFDPSTQQRRVDTGSIELSIRPNAAAEEDGLLTLTCELSVSKIPRESLYGF